MISNNVCKEIDYSIECKPINIDFTEKYNDCDKKDIIANIQNNENINNNKINEINNIENLNKIENNINVQNENINHVYDNINIVDKQS